MTTTTSTIAPLAHPTRRGLLMAAPAITAVAAVPAIALAPATSDRSAWNAAFAAYQRAKAEDEAFSPIYRRVHDAWEAGRPSIDAINFKPLPSYMPRDMIAGGWDLDKAWRDYVAGEGKWWFSPDPEARKAEFRAALDSVQAYRDKRDQHRRDSGMDEADDRWEVLGERVAEAECALMDTPAPDLAALRFKLDHLLEPDSEGSTACWSRDYVAQTIADYQRLLGGA